MADSDQTYDFNFIIIETHHEAIRYNNIPLLWLVKHNLYLNLPRWLLSYAEKP